MFLFLGTKHRFWELWLGATLNAKITNPKHKNAKNVTLSRLQKGHLVILGELKQEGRVSLFNFIWELTCPALKFFTALPKSTDDWESIAIIDFGGYK